MRRDRSVLTPYAQKLRKQMTKEEVTLWSRFLKYLPVTVRRQKVFGPYIVDFYIAEKKLAIEIDGSQHYEDEGKRADELRDQYLAERGITVLRYSNNDINENYKAVCEALMERLGLETLKSE